jgi:hypothetical protein
MGASSTPTKQDWHSRLLSYSPIPSPQDDSDSITSKVKSTAEIGTLTSRRYALVVQVSSVSAASLLASSLLPLARVMGRSHTFQQQLAARDAGSGTELGRYIMHRVDRARARRLVALCISLRVSASFQYESAPSDRGSRMDKPNGILLNGAMVFLLHISLIHHITAPLGESRGHQ